MDIFLPKENNDSKTGEPSKDWEAIAHTSPTHKKAIASFEKYISILSERLKDIDIKTSDADRRRSLLEEKINKIEYISEKTINLVYFGFFALLIVVIGIGYGYWQFIKDSVRNDDLKYGISERIIDQENEVKMLKLCLSSNKWLNPKCFDN